MGKFNWIKALSIAGGAVTVAAISYLLLRDDDSNRSKKDEETQDKDKAGNKTTKKKTQMNKETLIQLLSEMVKLQTDTKTLLKDLTDVARKNNYDIMTVYNVALSYDTEDPLSKYQLDMPEFDALMANYRGDADVSEYIFKLMAAPETEDASMSSANILSVEKIIDIHRYMLKEMEIMEAKVNKIPNRHELEPKLLPLVIQSIICAKVEEKFKITAQEIEMSLGQQQMNLSPNVEFAKINIQMQALMNKIMGSQT